MKKYTVVAVPELEYKSIVSDDLECRSLKARLIELEQSIHDCLRQAAFKAGIPIQTVTLSEDFKYLVMESSETIKD